MASTPEENTTLVRRFLTDVVAGEDRDAFGAFVAEDIVDHNLVFGDGQPHEVDSGLVQSVLAAAGDINIEIEDLVAAEDTVAVRATVSGTHHGSLRDLAPTGTSFEIGYMWFYRIEEGKIAEVWSFPDGLGIVQQLTAPSEDP